MSTLVLNEKLIQQQDVKQKQITVSRASSINMGVRIWFQILTTEGELFQRWSMLMNNTDGILLLLQENDTLDIDYIDDEVSDEVNQTFDTFKRKIILSASLV